MSHSLRSFICRQAAYRSSLQHTLQAAQLVEQPCGSCRVQPDAAEPRACYSHSACKQVGVGQGAEGTSVKIQGLIRAARATMAVASWGAACRRPSYSCHVNTSPLPMSCRSVLTPRAHSPMYSQSACPVYLPSWRL